MSQRRSQSVKPIVAIVAGLSLWFAALNASARQQEQPGGEQAQPQAAEPAAPDGEQVPAPDAADAGAPPATEPSEPVPGQSAEAPSQKNEYVEPLLAERLYELAQARLREAEVTEPMWRQAAALLGAAARINPKDPRFPRLLAEARMKLADTDGAIAALTDYRKIDPADRVAQIQLIDLYAEQMQTADARLEYLRDVLGRESIPAEVRSHVAAACVPLLRERSDEEASEMVARALELSPLNPQALRYQYELLPPDATPAARATALMAMVRSNPAQPEVVTDLAGVIAATGLGRESLEWYSIAMRLYPRMGLPLPPRFVADAGAQLLVSGQAQALDGLIGAYLQARPEDPDAWFIRLAKEKAAGQKVERRFIDEAWNALSGNLAEVCKGISGGNAAAGGDNPTAAPATPAPGIPAPAGRPSTPPAPPVGAQAPAAGARPTATAADAMAAAKRVKAGDAQDLQPALAGALSDLAWLELFFAEDADAAGNWVAALREVLPAESVMLARLQGWLDLVAGRSEQAKEKLGPIAERDPLAALGMVRLAAKDAGGQAAADEQAKHLLATHRTGLAAAMVWADLRERNVKVDEHAGADDLRAEMDKFPRDWMQILDKPDAYYDVAADVVKVAHRFREPMFGRVTLRNKTDYDLTIGTAGIIRPDLWVDAKISGLLNRNFPGVAYDRIARHVVLPARQSFAQYVRVDQGALADTLEENPSASAQINASVLLNPQPTSGGVGPGPAGQRKSFGKSFVRSGFALMQPMARRRLMSQVNGGASGERILALDLLAAYCRVFAQQKELDDATRALAAEFVTAIATSRDDRTPTVALWATYLTARINPQERAAAIDALLSHEGWPARVLAVLAAVDLGPERQTEIATRVAEGDADATVEEFAAATLDVIRSLPSTQPATADADGGATPARAQEGASPTGPALLPEAPAGPTPIR